METIYKLETFKVGLKVSTKKNEPYRLPEEVYKFAKPIFNDFEPDQEHLVVFFLDPGLHVNGFKTIAVGATDQAVVDQKIIFRDALLYGAYKIVMVHNHPNGALKPSAPDNEITKRIKKIGDLLGISLLDHLIISRYKDGYYSYEQNQNIYLDEA